MSRPKQEVYMSSMTIKGSSHDLNLLQTAYEIGGHIRSFITDKADGSHFSSGPNGTSDQTQEGLVLERCDCGRPSRIHTPYGEWMILGQESGDWEKVMKAITDTLGLKRIERGSVGIAEGPYGSCWAITKWKDQKLEPPVYRADPIDYEMVENIWKDFTSTHDLTPQKKVD